MFKGCLEIPSSPSNTPGDLEIFLLTTEVRMSTSDLVVHEGVNGGVG